MKARIPRFLLLAAVALASSFLFSSCAVANGIGGAFSRVGSAFARAI